MYKVLRWRGFKGVVCCLGLDSDIGLGDYQNFRYLSYFRITKVFVRKSNLIEKLTVEQRAFA